MSYIMIDIEADGPIPGQYSMISIGAVLVDRHLKKRFYAELKPISDKFSPEALAVTGFSRELTLEFEEPEMVMLRFEQWLQEHSSGQPMFISDNNGFDWMFVCWYFHRFLQRNPFGHSSTNLNSFYKGLMQDVFKNFKHLRQTTHTHNALDDAIGNAEAFVHIINDFDLNIKL